MSEKRCGNCEFWNENMGNKYYGFCNVPGSCVTGQITHQDFGCIHWQEKKPDVRERVAQYLFRSWAKKWKTLVGYEAAYENITDGFRDEFFANADELLAIVRGDDE
jgi:hypothetical protein